MDAFEQKSIAPMLIAENRPAFNDPNYLYELKFDGVRCIAYLDKTGTVLRNKRNKDVSSLYPELAKMHQQIKGRCILDGEVFVLRDGRTDFFEMQRRSLMANAFKIKLAADKMPVTFTAFDILYRNGEELNHLPLTQRKKKLTAVMQRESAQFNLSRIVEHEGVAFYRAAAEKGLEGIVAKRRDSLYSFGKRTKDWIKCKALLDDDFIVCGYYRKAANLVSVILGQYLGQQLEYQSHVVMGGGRADYQQLSKAREAGREPWYASFPNFDGVRWLEPCLVCKVEFMERTRNGGLRQPVYQGLRDDKTPADCIAPD